METLLLSGSITLFLFLWLLLHISHLRGGAQAVILLYQPRLAKRSQERRWGVCPITYCTHRVWPSAFVPASLNCHLALSLCSSTALSPSLSGVPRKLITFLFVMGLIMQFYKCHLILLLFNSIEEGEKKEGTQLYCCL